MYPVSRLIWPSQIFATHPNFILLGCFLVNRLAFGFDKGHGHAPYVAKILSGAVFVIQLACSFAVDAGSFSQGIFDMFFDLIHRHIRQCLGNFGDDLFSDLAVQFLTQNA